MLLRRFITTFLFIATSSLAGTDAKPEMTKDRLSDIADIAQHIASQYHETGWFWGSILLAKDGKPFFIDSYGLEDIARNRKNSAKTKFNLGSIMKNFTKVLVLQQVESGKLSLDDTLDTFQLGFPKHIATKITLAHLLNHSAGFGDIFTAEYREKQLSFDTLNKKLQLLMHEPLLFEPGTDHKYSNYGYIVLGAVLEKVTHRPFEKLLAENIFERIHLKNTSFTIDTPDNHQSTRYTYLYNGAIKEVGVTEHPSPDGGIESSVQDVLKFYRALFYSDTLLTRTNPLVRKAFAMNAEHWAAYGGGLGVSAAVEVNLADGIEIVVLANTDHLVAEYISARIHSYIKSGTYQEIKALEVNYAYRFYKQHGKQRFYRDFKAEYANSGYSQFIGRTVNELGMQLLKSQSWDEAFDIFNYLVEIFPNAPQAYDSVAFAYLSTGDADKAKSTFQKALDLNPGFNSDYVSNNYGHGFAGGQGQQAQ